ncbi:MAG TPA: ComF family protein [Candidatus Sulfotelmatobacter sp.]|nr:ComF family protein [Candidatus Sulfotelmatobacter sp.]
MSALIPSLRTWLDAGLAFFYPETCQLCRQGPATPQEGYVCAACRSQVRWLEPPFCQRCGKPFQGQMTQPFECANCRGADLPFVTARSAVLTRDPVLEVIHRYKYWRALWFEPFLAQMLIDRAAPGLSQSDWNCLVPVPLHPTKERERAFNQAERLARRLGTATDLPVHTEWLQRLQPTRTQTQLDREQRQANVRRAFAMRGRTRLHGQRIVLIDDVFTTGATTTACAQVLQAAGADKVCVWTVARGI